MRRTTRIGIAVARRRCRQRAGGAVESKLGGKHNLIPRLGVLDIPAHQFVARPSRINVGGQGLPIRQIKVALLKITLA